jgi:hypothetical protein
MQIWSREATSKKVETDSTFSLRIFSLTNHIAEIWFSLRANKFAEGEWAQNTRPLRK